MYVDIRVSSCYPLDVVSVNYATCDISVNRQVPQMSRQTNHPIKAVPWIFFYSGGFPVACFKGKKNIPSLQAFINKALQEAENRRQRTQNTFVPPNQGAGNMYSGGQYSRAPSQGHPQGGRPQGGRPQGPPPKYWKPEIGKAPSITGIVKGGGNTQYSYLGNQVQEEDEEKALVPEDITPHNKPWDSGYRRMGTFD